MTVHRRDEAPFVGRDELLAEFRSAIDEAHDGRGACFLLTGEPGIGKTSCLEQLRRMARAKGLQVLSGRCTQEEEGAPAYWPWIQALRDLGTGQSLSAGLERAGSGGDGVRARRFRLFDALARELRDAAAQQAILILLDDLHRADVPSLLLLRHLIRECAESGIVVVAAQRTSASVGPSQADRTLRDVRQAYRSVALTGISIEAIVRLIELSLEGPAPPGLARALHGRTGGNPLFVSQLLQLLASRSGSREGFDDTTALLPSGIQDAIRDRIASLPDEAHMLLEAAAAIGTEFRLELLARLWTSAREALEGLDAPLASRILSRDSDDPGAFRFVHALLRDAVYESTPLRTRLELHEAILRGLESIHRDDLDSVLARLAHHATEAAPRIGWEPAFRYCERAADHAASHLAHEEAIRHYQSALHALRLASDDEPSVRCLSTRVHLKLGRARWQAGEHTAAREEFLHAARGARDIEDADTFAQAAFGFAGKSDATMGVNRDAVALLEEALQRLGPEDAALTSQIMARLATELYFAEESERRERLARNAVAMAERVGDDATLAYDLTALCHVLHPHGGAEILPLADRLITTARRARIKDVEALGHHHRLLVHQRANDLGTAAEAVSQYARLAREMRDPWFEWAATAYRAGIALAAGRLDETERLIEHGFEIGNAVDTPNTLSFFGGTLFFLRRDQGRLAEMEDAIRAMVARTPEFPVFRLALAQVLAEADNLEEARPIYESIVRRWKTVPHDAMWSACAEIASHLVILFDDPRGAGRLRDTLAEQPDDGLIVGFGNAWLGSARLPLGRICLFLGEIDEAARHLERAVQIHRHAGAPLLEARSRVALAEAVARRSPGAAQARSEAREALRLAERGGYDHLVGHSQAIVHGPDPEAVFHRVGDYWELGFEGRTTQLRHAKGLDYLAQLLAMPHHEVHVSHLVGTGGADLPLEPGLPILDRRAREEYRARIASLREALAEAERHNDLGSAERARTELERLQEEVTSALGLSGRPRRTNDAVERSRKSVTNRIRSTIRRIRDLHPELGAHLDRTIQTGTFCSYVPVTPVDWQL